MAKICDYASKIDDDLYLCNKYNAYCLLDEPNRKRCVEMYGEEYNESDDIKEDENNVEEII